jgi:hypothetical protein
MRTINPTIKYTASTTNNTVALTIHILSSPNNSIGKTRNDIKAIVLSISKPYFLDIGVHSEDNT